MENETNSVDKQSIEELQEENRFVHQFWNTILNFLIAIILVVILSICLFKGEPDMIDSLIIFFSKGG